MSDPRAKALVTLSVLAVMFLLIRICVAFLEPSYSFIDDLIYVGSAIRLDLGETCAPFLGNACNYEHPPLAKLFFSLGFEIFGRTQVVGANIGLGINQLGGRFFQIVMASLLAPITYLIVEKMSGNWTMALLAGLFVLVDPLLFTLSLTAGLDVPMVFFAELAIVPYVFCTKVWRLDRYLISGGILGLSLLSKETAAFVILSVLSYNLLLGEGDRRE